MVLNLEVEGGEGRREEVGGGEGRREEVGGGEGRREEERGGKASLSLYTPDLVYRTH